MLGPSQVAPCNPTHGSARPVEAAELPTAWVQPELRQAPRFARKGYAGGTASSLASLALRFYELRRADGLGIVRACEAAALDAGKVVTARPDLFAPAQVVRVSQNHGRAMHPDRIKRHARELTDRQLRARAVNTDLASGLTLEHYAYNYLG